MKRLRHLTGPILLTLVAVFLGPALLANWQETRQYEWHFDPPFLALSVALILLYYA